MNKVRNYLLFLGFVALFISCSTEYEPQMSIDKDGAVEFNGYFGGQTRATETAFENGDLISLFAVDPMVSSELKASGNYADNVKYTYNGTGFKAGTKGVVISESNTTGYAYYAIYPYMDSADDAFTFSANSDQSTHAKYTSSDLCTAYHTPTTSQSVELEFFHRLSHVVVKFTGNNITSKNLVAELNGFMLKSSVDINDDKFVATGTASDVAMYEPLNNEFKAIVAPQKRYANDVVMTVTMGGTQIELSLARDIEFKSGYETTFELVVTDDSITELHGKLTPWSNRDDRLEEVVPKYILDDIDDYMPIYNGVNPPNVVGTYYIEPFVAVYCEDGGYDPGEEVIPEYITFSNQSSKDNTLDMYQYDDYGSWMEGKGAFISGSGNDFTAFFNSVGETDDVSFKTALVVSGTKASSGIKNLYYAFVMVEKGYDPDEILMNEGVFRVFKDEDGLSRLVSSRAESVESKSHLKWTIFSYCK